MGFCFHHWLSMTSKGTERSFSGRWECCLFPNDRKTQWICILPQSRPVIMLPWREIVRLLKKIPGKRMLASHKTTSSRTFAPWLVGVLPGNRSPFLGCWLISQQSAVGSRKYNMGGDLEEVVVSMGVCVKTEPHVVYDYYSLLLQPCSALFPWIWPLQIRVLERGDHCTSWMDSLVGTQEVGEKVRDSPRWPSKHGEKDKESW